MNKKYNMRGKKPGKLKSFIYHQNTLTVIGIVVLVLIAVPLVKNINKQHKLNLEISDLKGEIGELEGSNKDLSKFVEYLKTDEFVEEQARLNLNFKKAGEEVVVIKHPEDSDKQPGETETSTYKIPGLNKKDNNKISNALRWWHYFLDK